MILQFSLDCVPIGKGRPRITMRGGYPRMYADPKTKAFEEEIAWAAKAAGAQPLELPCTVDVQAFFPIPCGWSKKKQKDAWEENMRHTSRPDADNLCKIALDGLNGIAWKDDKQVYKIQVEKFYGSPPRLIITIQYVS